LAQSELLAYIENQSNEIVINEIAQQASAIDKEANSQQSVSVESILATENFFIPATPTERYKQGWQVGDTAIPNSIGGEYFVNWCEGQPVTIQSIINGQVGQIQSLKVTRHDGKTDMSFGNWLEEALSSKVTIQQQSSFLQEVETPDVETETDKIFK